MIICFVTAPRLPAYMHQTLASMLLADADASSLRVKLILDADNDEFVEQYKHNGRVEVARNLEAIRSVPTMQRVTLGFRRALLETHPDEELLIAEDDIVFRDGWLRSLRAAAAESRKRSGDRFLLSGYAAYEFSSRPIAAYPAPTYYGNQLLYVPTSVRAPLAAYMAEHVNEENGDMLVKRYAHESGTPIWATVPSLVQHVGKVSGASSPWHYTPMWNPKPETVQRELRAAFDTCKRRASDINEHLPLLAELASQCEHVTEMGVRGGESTTALLVGQPATLRSYDIVDCAIVYKLWQWRGRTDFVFAVGDSLKVNIEPTDMLFIDTLHTGEQLRAELLRHAPSVKRWIALHDTTSFGESGEVAGTTGLWSAVEEFLQRGDFVLRERRTNNNGLTVLERVAT